MNGDRRSQRAALRGMFSKIGSVAGVAALAVAVSVSAHERAHAQAQRAAPRAVTEGLSGSYVAGIVASARRDTKSAAQYFNDALRRDPRNRELLEQTFIADLADGDMDAAFAHAQTAANADRGNALAQLAIGVRAIRAKEYAKARAAFSRATGRGANADVTVELLKAWALVGAGDINEALKTVDRFTRSDLESYRNFFGGLIAAVGKRPQEAGKRLAAAYQAEPATLRVADAYGRWLAGQGRREEALTVFRDWTAKNPGQPFMERPIADLAAGRAVAPFVAGPAEGSAEVLYGLGAAGAGAREPLTAIVYMQLASYLSPQDDVIRVTLAEVFDQLRQPEQAAALYGAVKEGSPLRNRALIGRAAAFERLERTDEAVEALRTLLKEWPGDVEASETLGAIFRGKKRWGDAIEVYSAAVERIAAPDQTHWNLFFGRAIAYERAKLWAKAEPDFLKALDLLPPQPRNRRQRVERAQVLNYLAYSWVDMGLNIERSFEMLKQAVELAPDDGAIVDSLGWAYYRLGRYDDAVRELEKAIELRAGDSTINDHLGDAYWKVGRRREAYFKWQHALGSKPEPEDEAKLRKKLEAGLDAVEGAAVAVEPPKPNGG